MNTLYKAGIAVSIFALVASGHCPVQETIAPCICGNIGEGISVQCEGPDNIGNIPSVLESLVDPKILELVLDSLTVRLSASAPSLRRVTSLRLYDTRIEKVQSNFTFDWDELSEVILESSSIENEPLPDFRDARKLSHFEISKVEIPTIGSTFRENIPDGLTYLDVRRTITNVVEPEALSHLKKLRYFIMVDLPIQDFSRKVLPVIVPDLHTFILGNTKIENLEENFFDGMPKLEVIMLNGNKLTTLDSSWFAPVDNQLTHLLAERNPLVCDCNLIWLKNNVQDRISMKLLATCKDDVTLQRHEVISLDENEYCS